MTQRTMFCCPQCFWISRHPKDIEQGYCGNCHDFTGERSDTEKALDIILRRREADDHES